ncbi:MAG: restriction endonuclease subunit S [Enterococcus faecalis]|nr:restriction endonuclease subunit S [Enterococcus faecalis]
MCKLGDLGSVAMNKRIFKEQTSESGDIPFYKIGTFGATADAFISRELFETYKKKYPYPKIGDLLISASGSIGRVVEYKGNDEYFQDSNIVWLKHDDRINNLFLKQFYSIVKWHGLEGSTIKRLYNKNILETTIHLPVFDEQEKIGTLFKQLDDTITLHQRKLDQLKNLKNAFLQLMFVSNSPENSTVPKLRFANFTEEWELCVFFDTIENTIDFRGRTPKKLGLDWSDNGYLALSALNVKHGYIDPNIDAHYGNQELYDKWMSGKELRKGQVLFTTEAPMGNVAQIPDNTGYILSQRTIAFETKKNRITDDFLAVLLGSPKIFNELSSLSSGGTAKGISQKSLSQLRVQIPCSISEQKEIGIFFKQLNETITLHQNKLDQLKELKKSYLQNMFI